MLKMPLLHPQILFALGRAGHSSKILIADANYPFHTRRGANAEVVYLNFAPGQMTATDVLIGIANAVPFELAEVMQPPTMGANAMRNDPPVYEEFRKTIRSRNSGIDLTRLERKAFYEAASAESVALTIATGEQRLYGNILLTIGVVG